MSNRARGAPNSHPAQTGCIGNAPAPAPAHENEIKMPTAAPTLAEGAIDMPEGSTWEPRSSMRLRHDDPVYFNDDAGNTIIRCCDCGWETDPSRGPALKEFETHRKVFGGE